MYRDILYNIITRAPHIGLTLNKYWRHFILSEPSFYEQLPQKCIYCGCLFLANSGWISGCWHTAALLSWKKIPRITSQPLSANSLPCKFTIEQRNLNWETFLSTSQTKIPLRLIESLPSPLLRDNKPLWVSFCLPLIANYQYNHYDFWMIQIFFGGIGYCFQFENRLAVDSNRQQFYPTIHVRMKKAKMLKKLHSKDSITIFINI